MVSRGVKDAYETGRGRIVVRATAEIESGDAHDKIVITEIPYGVNKEQLVMAIADLAKEGRVDGIANVNDESGRLGMRIVVDVKREANANVLLNKLFKLTALRVHSLSTVLPSSRDVLVCLPSRNVSSTLWSTVMT